MSWTDEEIDNLFREGANAQSFEYDNAYFSEIEAALPINKKGKDFLWMGTALLFIVALTTGYVVTNSNDNSLNGYTDQLANLELNKETDVDSKSSIIEQQSTNGTNELNNESSNSSLTSADLANGASSNKTSNIQSSNLQTKAISASQNSTKQTNVTSINAQPNLIAQSNAVSSSDSKINEEANPANAEPNDLRTETKAFDQKKSDVAQSPITAGLAVNSANEIDQNLDRSLMPTSFPILSELRPKAAFYLELNGGISQAMITEELNDPSEFSTTNYGGGIGVVTYLGNFNLTTGLNLNMAHHKDLSMTRSGKLYGFGSTSSMDTYNYKKIYSLELPITLGYNFGNHNLNLGIRPSVLIGSKITHQSFTDQQLIRSNEIYGLAGGLTRFGLKPTIGYSYHMNKWSIGANIGVQLMQGVNEDFIDGVNYRLPIDGQIYLRRTIRLRK